MALHFEFEERVGRESARVAGRVVRDVLGRREGDWHVRFFRIDQEALGVRVGHQSERHVCRLDTSSGLEHGVRGALASALASLGTPK